jgi:hypothetical protein
MSRRVTYVFRSCVVALCALVFACAKSQSVPTTTHAEGTLTFHGIWRVFEDNPALKTRSAEVSDVTVDGVMIRVLTVPSDPESLPISEVYDGARLHTKAGKGPDAYSRTERPTQSRVSALRWWDFDLSAYTPLEKSERIVGRLARQYRKVDSSPARRLETTVWIDAEKQIMLKCITKTTGQAGEVLLSKTWECEKVDFVPIDKSAFAKP